MKDIVWKEVKSKPHFLVAEDGRVMWEATGTVLSSRLDKDGYVVYSYRCKGKTFHISCHRAVAEAYVENPIPDKYNIVNHKNGIRDDNRPCNLEWTDSKGNRIHCQATGNHHVIGEQHSQAKIDSATALSICHMIDSGERNCDIARHFCVKAHIVANIKSGKAWSHISCEFPFNNRPKITVSENTLEWLRNEVAIGRDIKPILECNNRLTKDEIDSIVSLTK